MATERGVGIGLNLIGAEPAITGILQGALAGQAPSRRDCVRLLELLPGSVEAGLLRSVADVVMRRRFANRGIILGQIGVEIGPCPGQCKFCSFGDGHTAFAAQTMSGEEILERARGFAAGADLFALFLMTLHTFDFGRLLEIVRTVKSVLAGGTQVVVNIGDFDLVQARELQAAGVDGAYHVCRLREGTDTALDPAARRRTIRVIREAGLDWYYCCEPVGPEHSAAELVEQLWLGIEYGCFQHAAMRRVWVPDAPLSDRGQITEFRLAQVVAVVALASLNCPETRNIAVHEPNLLGLAAGANAVYAEAGANPRDTESDTTGHRGLDVRACRRMLYEAGFDELLWGDGTTTPLTYRPEARACASVEK